VKPSTPQLHINGQSDLGTKAVILHNSSKEYLMTAGVFVSLSHTTMTTDYNSNQ